MHLYAIYQCSLLLEDEAQSLVEKSRNIAFGGGNNAGVSAAVTAAQHFCLVRVIGVA